MPATHGRALICVACRPFAIAYATKFELSRGCVEWNDGTATASATDDSIRNWARSMLPRQSFRWAGVRDAIRLVREALKVLFLNSS